MKAGIVLYVLVEMTGVWRACARIGHADECRRAQVYVAGACVHAAVHFAR